MNYSKELLATVLFLLVLCLSIGCQQGKEKQNVETEADRKEKKLLEGMIHIPAGEFIMGSNDTDKEMIQQRFGMRKIPYINEHPQRKVNVGDYYIDKYEVTNRQYKVFVDDTQYVPPVFWVNGKYPEGVDDYPVTMVSWFNGDAYCRWMGKKLPTEEEWEKAARGTDGRMFAWGNKFDEKKANILGLNGGVMPAGNFKDDLSPYGLYDMVGNVSEWMIDWYNGYPGNKFMDKEYGKNFKVLRGGSWGGIGHYSFELFYRIPFRNNEKPEMVLNDVGFRCAYSKT